MSITIKSNLFYVSVPHADGEALFEFPTQQDVDNFLAQSKHLAPNAYQLTAEEITEAINNQAT